MIPLFSDQGRKQLESLVDPGMLCAFDFDGTLSPFHGYENAALPDEIRDRLIRLQSMTPVAVLTGRALSDIRERLTFKPDFLVANHGLEGVPGRENGSDRYRRRVDCWVDALKTALQDPVRYDRGIQVDDKRYSVAVHYRKAADYEATEKRLLKLFEQAAPDARVLPGKFVYNLIPPGAPDKGDAFSELMKITGSKTALYAGDDMTDEDVFRLASPDVLTIRIGEKTDSQAQFYLETQEDIVTLLDVVIALLTAKASFPDNASAQRNPT